MPSVDEVEKVKTSGLVSEADSAFSLKTSAAKRHAPHRVLKAAYEAEKLNTSETENKNIMPRR